MFNPSNINPFSSSFYEQYRSLTQNQQDDSYPSNRSVGSAPAQREEEALPPLPRRDNAFTMRALYDALPGSQSARYAHVSIHHMDAPSPGSESRRLMPGGIDLNISLEHEATPPASPPASLPPEARVGASQSMRWPGQGMDHPFTAGRFDLNISPEREATPPASPPASLPPEARVGASQSMRWRGQGMAHPFTEGQFMRAIEQWAQGATREQAARHANINPSHFRRYVDRNKLTALGQGYVNDLSLDNQREVSRALERQQMQSRSHGGMWAGLRRMFRGGGSGSHAAQPAQPAPVPEAGWQQGGSSAAASGVVIRERERSSRWASDVVARAEAPQEQAERDLTGFEQAFMANVEHYGKGKSLRSCQAPGMSSFYNYFKDEGGLKALGITVYNRLPPTQRDKVDAAIQDRKSVKMNKSLFEDSNKDKFMAVLDPYAKGEALRECQRRSNLRSLFNYFTDAGSLNTSGKAIYDKLLSSEEKTEVDTALRARTVWFARNNISRERFFNAAQYFSNFTMPLDAIAQAVGLRADHLALVLSDSGLTEAGRMYMEQMFDPQTQATIDGYIRARTVGFAMNNIAREQFVNAAQYFSNFTVPLDAIAQAVGLQEDHLALVLSDSGLTEAGRAYMQQMFDPQTQEMIDYYINLRIQR